MEGHKLNAFYVYKTLNQLGLPETTETMMVLRFGSLALHTWNVHECSNLQFVHNGSSASYYVWDVTPFNQGSSQPEDLLTRGLSGGSIDHFINFQESKIKTWRVAGLFLGTNCLELMFFVAPVWYPWRPPRLLALQVLKKSGIVQNRHS